MADKKQKKVLISGYIGFSNFGDDALLSVLVKKLKQSECAITALSSNPEYTKKIFGIESSYYKNVFSIIREVLKCDVLISGGGNLIQNETSNNSLYYYLFIILLAKLCFKKVALYSQGIGPIDGSFQKFISKLILKMADIITVRDIYSQRILNKWKIKSKFTYDAVWNLKLPKYEPKNIVGIQVRNYNNLNKDFDNRLAKYVDMFFSDYEIKIFSFENKNDSSRCYSLLSAIKSRNHNIKVSVIPYKNLEQVINEFQHLKYLIAMRLHANILGLKYGIKVLPVSYSVKVRNLAYEFNIPFAEAVEEIDFHALLSDLTQDDNKENHAVEDARKRQFEWAFLEPILK